MGRGRDRGGEGIKGIGEGEAGGGKGRQGKGLGCPLALPLTLSYPPNAEFLDPPMMFFELFFSRLLSYLSY